MPKAEERAPNAVSWGTHAGKQVDGTPELSSRPAVLELPVPTVTESPTLPFSRVVLYHPRATSARMPLFFKDGSAPPGVSVGQALLSGGRLLAVRLLLALEQ